MTPCSQLTGLAIDIGGTKIAAAQIEGGKIIKRLQTATPKGSGFTEWLDCLPDLISQFPAGTSVPVGVAVTGRVDADGCLQAVNKQTMKQMPSEPLAKLIEQRIGRSVTMLNDVQAAALGEYRLNQQRYASPFAFISISTGVGGGIVAGDTLLKAPSGLQGHVGFASSRFATSTCGSGRFGTVESIASGTAIGRIASELRGEKTEAPAVFAAMRSGEAWATNIVRISALAIAEVCSDLRAIVGVESVALGGSVGLAEGYLDMVLEASADIPEIFRPAIKPAVLGHDAGLWGALIEATSQKQLADA
ncbi:ROK family protein [Rhodobacteraceae bacterium RKSG542]|uniref:ROK family protein n=1 Tax=Pseudovibrio flavus TaxID=2529854 RepID=UPI0012BBD5A6|nr:ROK family protein [Pseudovibrio flavus]MTI16460.1 ROK family protein [Pseudovibrio flavus]